MDIKQVKVDNWGIFFLQRLHLFFSKTDYCDLTLQFEGNVQLKVHRLVLNACTDYFEMLENSDRLIDENTILMPEVLQADVIVPIVNFMYTGMLEFPLYVYDKLYHAAELMKINILTKLLDAQRHQLKGKKDKHSTSMVNTIKKNFKNTMELPAALPGRKLPVWKRKNAPQGSTGNSRTLKYVKSSPSAEAAKPARFEWSDDDLPQLTPDVMDVSEFGEISYTSTPLLREDDIKIKCLSKDDSEFYEENHLAEKVISPTLGDKRKSDMRSGFEDNSKKIKITETEKEATISIVESGSKVDPTKIVSDILKRYPSLVKKNKSIKLKILTKPKDTAKELKKPVEPSSKTEITRRRQEVLPKSDNRWYCYDCREPLSNKPTEFILYYLYRKHMTDVHDITFDPQTCIYCGVLVKKKDYLPFHLFTKHGVKPNNNATFYQCNLCPCIMLTPNRLVAHKKKHSVNELQCSICKLAFGSAAAITNHFHITGHQGKGKRSVFDCQFCMHTSSNSLALLIHIKEEHEPEARKEGIVSLDEELDNVEDDDEEEEEYIIPEKVNILSNVKVDTAHDESKNQMIERPQNRVQNVPGTIATSLGLLDIVVLDENQQYILQNQSDQQTEYILPNIAPNNNQQTVISQRNNDIPSTDELVMVLTDNDYHEEEPAEISGNNSNIVVLYSHPVDGGQEQFITSQGNLMVDSQTGLLEIRNGAITTTASNSIMVSTSTNSPIETIEMIEREIQYQNEKISENYDVERNNAVQDVAEKTASENEQLQSKNEEVLEEKESEDKVEELKKDEKINSDVDVVDSNQIVEEQSEEAMEIEESDPLEISEEKEQVSEPPPNSPPKQPDEGEDIPPCDKAESSAELKEIVSDKIEETQSNEENATVDVEESTENIEEMEVDGPTVQLNTSEATESNNEDAKENESTDTAHDISTEENVENSVENDGKSEIDVVDNSLNSDIIEASPSPKKEESPAVNEATKTSILDDWDDTDSQNSENKSNDRQVTVNKLMDDWEEDEDDDNKKVKTA